MKTAELFGGLLLFAVIVLWSASTIAQELDAKWLLGAWSGTSPSPLGRGDDRREIVFQEGGRFRGDVQSVRGGLLEISGTYKIVGSELLLDGVYQGGPVHGAGFSISLKRNGDELEGRNQSKATGLTIPITLKRAK